MAQGTSFEENVAMLKAEIRIFPHGRIFHKLLNILVEYARAFPKRAVLAALALGATCGALTTWLLSSPTCG